MVKKIRKRKTKKQKQEGAENTVNPQEGEGTLNAESSTSSLVEADEAARLSLAEQLQMEAQAELAQGGDRFEETAEQILMSVAVHWKTIVAILVIISSLYGFVQLSQSQARKGLAEDRSQLIQAQDVYQTAQAEQIQYALKQVKWYQDNPDSFTSPNIGQPPSKEALKKASAAFAKAKSKVSGQGIYLAELGEASTEYDLASTADEYKKAGELFKKIAQNQAIEQFTRAIAYQNSAVSFEQANQLDLALQTWMDLNQLNSKIYGLFAQTHQARLLARKSEVQKAKDLYTRLQETYKSDLQKGENQALKNQIKIALARLNAR
jgi:hypothetical protein